MSRAAESDTPFWISAGGALLITCVVITLCSLTFVHGEGYTSRPIVEVVGLLSVAGLVYVVAASRSLRAGSSLRWIVTVSIAARLVLLAGAPIQEDDLYRYMWDGRVVAEGINPYRFSPDDIEESRRSLAPRVSRDLADLEALDRLARKTESNATIFSRINNRSYATIYPPVVQAVFWVFGVSVPDGWPVHAQVIGMKLLMTAFDVLTLFLLILLLRSTGKPTSLVLLYGWCPLVFKEIANSGHMDAIPAAFLVGALLLLLRRQGLFAGLLLGLAIGAKVYAILVLPLFLRRLGWRQGVLCASACLVVLFGGQLAAGDGADRLRQTLFGFALGWENHDALFLWIHSLWHALVASSGDFSLQWSAFAFTQTGGIIQLRVGVLEAQTTLAYVLALTTVAAALLICVLRTLRGAETAPSAELVRRVFVSLACLFLVGPLGFPWYFLWCVPFLPFVRMRSWLLLVVLLPTYYLRFWFDYHYEHGVAGFESGVDFFDYVIVSAEFGLFFVVAAFELRSQSPPASEETRRT